MITVIVCFSVKFLWITGAGSLAVSNTAKLGPLDLWTCNPKLNIGVTDCNTKYDNVKLVLSSSWTAHKLEQYYWALSLMQCGLGNTPNLPLCFSCVVRRKSMPHNRPKLPRDKSSNLAHSTRITFFKSIIGVTYTMSSVEEKASQFIQILSIDIQLYLPVSNIPSLIAVWEEKSSLC